MVLNKNIRKKSFLSNKIALIVILGFDFLLLLLLISSFGDFVIAVISQNATVATYLTVGSVSPEILNISINGGDVSLDLAANSTTSVFVEILARDWNGEADFNLSYSEFFDVFASSYGDLDDNNYHYTNSSCGIDYSYGTSYEVNYTCIFYVHYYANNATWNATVRLTDNSTRNATASDLISINSLLALGLPDSIDYGTVNETEVSAEKMVNVTNFGNVAVNLSLQGYARTPGDNYSMNCSLGNIRNISVGHQKFNLTSSNTSNLNLNQFQSIYMNLTGNRSVWRFDLANRQNDVSPYLDDTNATYWRIFVPLGVAGSCNGNLVFGATIESGA